MNKQKHSPVLWISALVLLGASQLATAAPPIDAGKAPGHLIVRAMDSNDDGVISRDEFKPLKRGSRLNMFIEADTNEDNEVSPDELTAFLSTQPANRHERVLKRFASQDLNGDGTLALSEIHDQMFANLDADGNGELDAAEVGPARQERRGNTRN